METELEIAVKLCFALLMGALIGLERELQKNVAGLRTHMLVCMASALLIVVSKDVGQDMGVATADPMRVAAGVITGIGFLGAGTIIKHGATVQGLTTAASIWTAAAVGIAVGVGYYTGSLLVVLLTLFTLYIVHKVDQRLAIYKRRTRMIVTVEYHHGVVEALDGRFDRWGLEIGEFSVDRKAGRKGQMVIEVQLRDTGGLERSEITRRLLEMDEVDGVDFY